MRFDLWAAISYGQNLDVKELRGRNLDNEGPKRDDAISAHRHGLDHHCASWMRGARSDVTRGLWKKPNQDSRDRDDPILAERLC